MERPAASRLLQFARELQRATSFRDLLEVTRAELHRSTGYTQVWLCVADHEDPDEVRVLAYSGSEADVVWEKCPVIPVRGDRMMEEILAAEGPVVVEDARVDPRTNKTIVEQLGNRTIVNVPLCLVDKPLGCLGTGTFGDEGCRPPTPAQLEHLAGMAGQVAVAASRIRLSERRREDERDRAETDRRLQQVQRLESLGLLAGGVAHDFNNLLTIIQASAAIANGLTNDEPLRVELATIKAAAERGKALTTQLLAMSREQALSMKAIDLNEGLTNVVRLLRRVLPAAIEVDLIPAARLPTVEGDQTKLDQVFMNLLLNARDAMPNGGRITIETEQVVINGRYTSNHPWAKPGRYVLVTVTDNGNGMPPEVVERIFEPLFTTKAEGLGTGLGLAVAYGIVRQHGGLIHCYSEVGLGTTFKVYFPVQMRLATDVGAKIHAKIHGATTGGHETILVAEDSVAVGEIAKRVLEGAGYKVVLVADGAAACERAPHVQPHLALVDVVMPGQSCAATVRRLHELVPEAKVLLASGYPADAELVAALGATVTGLVRKPYDPDDLLRQVRGALDET